MLQVSPYAVLGEIPVTHVRWTGGFWGLRFECCHKAMIPAMWRILEDDDLSHAFANFRIAAGLEGGVHSGPPFFDGDLYKWLEATASVFAATGDPELDRLMDHVIGVVAQAQRQDGYLHTPVLIAEGAASRKDSGSTGAAAQDDSAGTSTGDRAGAVALSAAPGALRDRLHFEVYNFGHLMTAACRHFQATGKRTLLDVAIRAADYLDIHFKDQNPEIAKNNICPSHYMGLAELYRTTGHRRFRDLASYLIDNRNLIKDGTDDNQDRIPFRQQRKAVGHAVRANYLYAGAADVYLETGDRTLLPALDSIWDNVVRTKTYITGGTGALYDGVSPDGDEDHWAIQRVHQAYGREYQLPVATAYNETCATIGSFLWNWRMLRISGNARHADAMETALYNGILSGISLDGTQYFYQNTLRELAVMPVLLRWPRHRAPYLTSFCCPPNVVRTIAGSAIHAWGLLADGVAAILYGNSRLQTTLPDGNSIVLDQYSGYPWHGDIVIRITEASRSPMRLDLRIPAWAEGASVSVKRVDGGAVAQMPPCIPGSFVSLRMAWQSGDEVSMHLPIKPRLVFSHPLVEESRNQAAVVAGPIVYCLETADLPEGCPVSAMYIDSSTEFQPIPGEGLLAGLTVLRCQGARMRSSGSDALYRDLSGMAFEDARFDLVPYFAWDNRMKGEMSVWLPVRWR